MMSWANHFWWNNVNGAVGLAFILIKNSFQKNAAWTFQFTTAPFLDCMKSDSFTLSWYMVSTWFISDNAYLINDLYFHLVSRFSCHLLSLSLFLCLQPIGFAFMVKSIESWSIFSIYSDLCVFFDFIRFSSRECECICTVDCRKNRYAFSFLVDTIS